MPTRHRGVARGRVAIVSAIALFASLVFVSAAQADLYYGAGNFAADVGRSGLDVETNPVPNTDEVQVPDDPGFGGNGMVAYGNHLYFSRIVVFGTDAIARVTLNPDGSVVTGSLLPNFIADIPGDAVGLGIDPDGSTLYAAHSGSNVVSANELDANGDRVGSTNPIFVAGLTAPRDVESDGQYVYISQQGQSKIVRATLAGGPYEDFITSATSVPALTVPNSLAIVGNNLYWSNATSTRIGRQKLDPVTRERVGNADNNFIQGLSDPRGITSDGVSIYILDNDGAKMIIRRQAIDAAGDRVGVLSGNLFSPTGSFTEGIFAVHDTATSVSCLPDPAVTQTPTTCTATVTDADPSSSPGLLAPKGKVTWSTSGNGALSAPTCTLAPTATAGESKCTVTYTGQTPGADTLTANYAGGKGINAAAPATFSLDLFARHSTSTVHTCGTDATKIQHPVTCTVEVTDTAPDGSIGIAPPRGTVSFDPSASGEFDPGPQCTLVALDADSAACSVSFDSSQIGVQTVEAAYGGEPEHFPSVGVSPTWEVKGRTSYVAVSCSPLVITTGSPAACEATVADTDLEAPTTPVGVVEFSSPAGTFTPSTCALQPSGGGEASCSGVMFKPTTPGTPMVTATYGGDALHSGNTGQRQVQVRGQAIKPPEPAPVVIPPPATPVESKKCKDKKTKKARKKCKKKKEKKKS